MLAWYYVYNENEKKLYCVKVESEKDFRIKFKEAKQHDVPQGLKIYHVEKEPTSSQFAGNPKIVKL